MVFGLKENLNNKQRIISAAKPKGFNLIDVTIFHLDENSNLIEKISQKFEEVDISENKWVLKNVSIFKPKNGLLQEKN